MCFRGEGWVALEVGWFGLGCGVLPGRCSHEVPRWQRFTSERGDCRQRGCVYSLVVEETFKLIDSALSDLQSFWHKFASSLGEYCIGNVGVATRMQAIMQSMSVVWWLPDVLASPYPSARHTSAMLDLYRLMDQDLRAMPWPSEDYKMSPNVRRWPLPAGMVVLYRKWWGIVYRAGLAAFHCKWFPATGFAVRPIMAAGSVLWLCTAKFPCRSMHLARCVIASLITSFIREPAAVSAASAVGGSPSGASVSFASDRRRLFQLPARHLGRSFFIHASDVRPAKRHKPLEVGRRTSQTCEPTRSPVPTRPQASGSSSGTRSSTSLWK